MLREVGIISETPTSGSFAQLWAAGNTKKEAFTFFGMSRLQSLVTSCRPDRPGVYPLLDSVEHEPNRSRKYCGSDDPETSLPHGVKLGPSSSMELRLSPLLLLARELHDP